MAPALGAGAQGTAVTMGSDRRPDQIISVEAEREEAVRLLLREPGLILYLFDRVAGTSGRDHGTETRDHPYALI